MAGRAAEFVNYIGRNVVVASKSGPVETVPTVPGGFFFWTRFHNLVVFDGENCACANSIAKQRYIRGRLTPLPLTILEYSSMTVAGESSLSLYKNSYTVQLLSCFYNLAWETGSVWCKRKELEWFDGYLSGRRQRVCIIRRGKEQVD